jgi:hypothetical protein
MFAASSVLLDGPASKRAQEGTDMSAHIQGIDLVGLEEPVLAPSMRGDDPDPGAVVFVLALIIFG